MDVWLEWNDDWQVSATGDLLLADGDDETRQSIIRRLNTAVKGYVWHPEYGAGLPQRIGLTANVQGITSVVRSQMNMENTVSFNPPPTVKVTQNQDNLGEFIIAISYISLITGQTVSFSITV